MSDFGTTRQLIIERIGRDRDLDKRIVEVEIAKAIRHYRHDDFFFNRATESFVAVVDQSTYEVAASPGPRAGTLVVRAAEWRDPDDATVRGEIDPSTIKEIRKYHREHTSSGELKLFAWIIDSESDSTETDQALIFAPAPDKTYTVYLDSTQDIGTPTFTYSSSAWEVQDPDDATAAIADGYTNAWLTHGQELIASRVMRRIYEYYFANLERASYYASIESNNLANLRQVTQKRRSGFRIKTFF